MRGGDEVFEILSQEGTTQGCPLSMAFYALSLAPLVNKLDGVCKHVWYADDATGCDKIDRLKVWFDLLLAKGPIYGYYPKPTKCILVSKPEYLERARTVFKGTNVEVQSDGAKDTGVELTVEGTRHLGAAIGTPGFKAQFIEKKVLSWIASVKRISQIATTQPHAAFVIFTHCLQRQWTFVSRSVPAISLLLQPLENEIRLSFIPSLLQRNVNDSERLLLSLPARFGGMGILNPAAECDDAHANSMSISEPLIRLILRQETDFDPKELETTVKEIRKEIDSKNDTRHKDRLNEILIHALPEMKQSIKLSSEKGASSWLTCVPSFQHGTILHKGDFVDAICIRYGWQLRDLPATCPCGSAFGVQHALDCSLGGFRTIQHNEVRDLLAGCMKEAGHSYVETEPALQPLHGEVFKYKSANKQDDARSDIKCLGFWSKMRQAFFDVKVVSPLARSYCELPVSDVLLMAEKAKSREYRERILFVEHGDFNPLVFTISGALGPQSSMVLKRLAEKISERQSLQRSAVAGWLRCRLSFALLRATLLCVRGRRKNKSQTVENNISLAVSEGKIEH